MFEHFDERARRCIVYAQEERGRLGHEELGTVHLLLANMQDLPQIRSAAGSGTWSSARPTPCSQSRPPTRS